MRMICPIPGAMIGTAMNTIIASDMTLAMRRPPKVSRMTDIAITRVAPAPKPCRPRIASSMRKLPENAAPVQPMT